jgi:Family of unknown function (DUF5684)
MAHRLRILPRLIHVLLGVALLPGALPAFAQDQRMPSAFAGGFFTLFMLFGLAGYIFVALALYTIAQKTNTENAWFAWIPILNIILILNIAKKPLWWIILLFIPLVNIIIAVLIWMGVAEARRKPGWWGVLTIIPLVNLIAIGYLAWAD